MDRETYKFNTPGGFEVEIKSYITGGEQRQIDGILIDSMDVNIADKTAELNAKKSKADIIYQQENKLIEIMVISINGETNDIVKKILEMKTADYNCIIKEINLASSGFDVKKKNE